MLTTVVLVVIALLTLIAALLSFQGRSVTIGFLSLVAFILAVVLLLLGLGSPAV
jgi:hypothetical protein